MPAGHAGHQLPKLFPAACLTALVLASKKGAHAASPPSTKDGCRARLAGPPREYAPAVVQRGQVSFDPSTGHQRFERLRVHMPNSQPTTRPTNPIPSATAITANLRTEPGP